MNHIEINIYCGTKMITLINCRLANSLKIMSTLEFMASVCCIRIIDIATSAPYFK